MLRIWFAFLGNDVTQYKVSIYPGKVNGNDVNLIKKMRVCSSTMHDYFSGEFSQNFRKFPENFRKFPENSGGFFQYK